MIPTHHAGNFLPKTKGFSLHDFTLIASVVGESVIGHGIGGKVSQLKWRNLLKASRWSKQRRSVVTQSHSHPTQVIALKSKYVDAMYYMEFLT
jgi:hypothetical protein